MEGKKKLEGGEKNCVCFESYGLINARSYLFAWEVKILDFWKSMLEINSKMQYIFCKLEMLAATGSLYFFAVCQPMKKKLELKKCMYAWNTE